VSRGYTVADVFIRIGLSFLPERRLFNKIQSFLNSAARGYGLTQRTGVSGMKGVKLSYLYLVYP